MSTPFRRKIHFQSAGDFTFENVETELENLERYLQERAEEEESIDSGITEWPREPRVGDLAQFTPGMRVYFDGKVYERIFDALFSYNVTVVT